MEADSVWILYNNPFLWQGVVFSLFGFLAALSLSAVYGLPKRLLESL